MTLIGAGQGGVLGPLTAAGLTGIDSGRVGAASGVTNVAHQLGGSLGLGILVAVFAAADSATLDDGALLAHRISAAPTGGTVMLALALAVVVAFIVRLPRPRTAFPEPARN
jgi:hypothetical protein